MKSILLLTAATSLLLAGCGEKTSSSGQTTNTATATGGNLLDAPGDYLKGAANARHSADKTVDVAALTKAVDLFNVDKGRYPKDLNELVTENYIKSIPSTPFGSKLNYDPASGQVKVVPQ